VVGSGSPVADSFNQKPNHDDVDDDDDDDGKAVATVVGAS